MERAWLTVVNSTQLSIFRGRLLRAAGVTLLSGPVLLACSNEVTVFEGGSGGASSSGSTGSGSTSGSSSTGNTTGSSGSTTGSSVAVTTSTGAGGAGGESTTVTTGAGGAGGGMLQVACFPDNGEPCPDLTNAETVFGPCTYDDFLWVESWVDGPVPGDPGECCYEVVTNGFCGVGRPYATHAGALVAKSRRRDDWKGTAGAVDTELSDPEREALVQAWTRDGLYEHASVASFSRFALELMSVGAPPELVAGAHRAALDEIEHARLCFALASRFAGEPIGPDAFPVKSDASVRQDLAAIAAATAAEGCVGETLAAALAAAQRDAATDPEVRQALSTIAEDEARHAELAWRTVAWALKTGGEPVRRAVAEAFAGARGHLIAAATRMALPSMGLLDPHEQTRIQMQVLTEVIGPCAQGLLAPVG